MHERVTLRPRPSLAPVAAAAAGYLALALVWFRGVLPDIAGRVYGTGDVFNYVWRIWWWAGGFKQVEGATPLFAPNVFFPEGHHLAEAELSPINLIQAVAISKVFGPVVAWNAVVLVSFVLSGLAAYAYAREMRVGRAGAFLAGLVFSFAPYHSVHAYGHLPLMGIWVLPLGLIAVERMRRALAEDRRKSTLTWAALLGVAVAASAWSSLYYLVIFGCAFAIYGLARLWGEREGRLRRLAVLSAAFVFGAVLVFPQYMVIALSRGDGASMDWSITHLRGAAPYAFFIPSPFSPLLGRFTAPLLGRNVVENSLYLGALPMLLAAISLRRKRLGRDARALVILAVSAFVLSLGPFLFTATSIPVMLPIKAPGWLLAKYGLTTISNLPVPMPALPVAFLPLFSGMREYTRFGIIVLAAVSVLAGAGLDAILEVAARRAWRWAPAVLLAVAVAVVAVDFVPRSMTTSAQPTEADRWLGDQPGNGSVLTLPSPREVADQQVYATIFTRKPLAIGDATFLSAGVLTDVAALGKFPDDAGRGVIDRRGVQWVVWRRAVAGPMPDPPEWLTLRAHLREYDIYEVIELPAVDPE